MNKLFLFITLVTTTLTFGAQPSAPNPCLPIDIQLKLAELKFDKIDLEIAKGPEVNYKDLIMPVLGMSVGGFCVIGSTAGVIQNRSDTNCAALLVGICVFAYSYWQFKSGDEKEVTYLLKKKETQREVIDLLKRQKQAATSA